VAWLSDIAQLHETGGEELEQFTRKVLIGDQAVVEVRPDVRDVRKEVAHGRRPHNLVDEGAVIAEGIAVQEVLPGRNSQGIVDQRHVGQRHDHDL